MGVAERKKREKEARIESIQGVARRLFAKKGIENTTMAEIAREAELAYGTLYLFFRSKEELLYTLMEPSLQDFVGQLSEVTSKNRERADRTLLKLAKVVVSAYEVDPDPFQVFIDYKAERIHPLFTEQRVERLKDLMRKCSEAVAAVIIRGINQGIFRELDPRPTAGVIWALMVGSCRYEQNRGYDGRNISIEKAVVGAMEIIVNGMKR